MEKSAERQTKERNNERKSSKANKQMETERIAKVKCTTPHQTHVHIYTANMEHRSGLQKNDFHVVLLRNNFKILILMS